MRLNIMTKEEYEEFYILLINNYAFENVQAGYWEEEEALEKSKKSTDSLLSKGLETENHYLFSLYSEIDKTIIGSLWLFIEIKSKKKTAFIYYIIISEHFRGKGYAKDTLKATEQWLKERQVQNLGLHVFASNKVARNLYTNFGFKVTSLNMEKEL